MAKPVGLTTTPRGYEYRQRVPQRLQAVMGCKLFYHYLGRVSKATAEQQARALRAHFDQIVTEARQLGKADRQQAIQRGGYLRARQADIIGDRFITAAYEGTKGAPQFDADALRIDQAEQLLASHELEQAAKAAHQRQRGRINSQSGSAGGFDDLISRWQRRTNPRSRNTITQTRTWCARFTQMTGCNDPAAVSVSDVVLFRDELERLADAGHFTRQTARHGLARLSRVFAVAVGDATLPANPFAAVRVTLVNDLLQPAARGFTDDEVCSILANLGQLQRPDHQWLVRLELFLGCRTGDLTNLHASDVRDVGGIMALDIHAQRPGASLKTRAAIRVVPLTTPVVDFAAFAASQRGQLFKGSTPRQAANFAQRVVNRFINELGVSGTLHDCRHTVVSRLRRKGVPEHVIAAIVGHSTGRTSTAGYGRGVDLVAMRDALETIRY